MLFNTKAKAHEYCDDTKKLHELIEAMNNCNDRTSDFHDDPF